ncbi:MAG: DUF4340 domain-containing protein [Candidatus Hydrogenedentes bacterium]|nr:DUF4340 domain-containing protein [Candidatus Hydrogenedentota bacterium]
MKARSLIFMLAVLVLLCSYYAGQEAWKRTQRTQAVEARKLFDFEAKALQKLSITRIGEPASTAERGEGGAWKITAPNASIDPLDMLWDRLCDRVAQLQNFRTIEEHPVELARYGLEEPVLVVEGATATESFTLRFGLEEPTRTYRYVQFNAGPIYLVPSRPDFFELNRSLLDLRHAFLVKDREDPILRLEYARILTEEDAAKMQNPPPVGEESETVIFARDDAQSPWRMLAPVEGAADQDKVNAFVSEVQFGLGENYIDTPEDLSVYKLEPARARITVSAAGDPAPQTLFVGDVDLSEGQGKLFARKAGQDAVFQISTNLLAVVPKSPADFREARLFTGEAANVVEIEYTSAAGSFLMNRVDDNWVMVNPAHDDIDTMAVSIYISNFKQTRVRDFLPGTPEEHGLDAPEATVSLRFGDGAPPAVLKFTPDPSNPDYYLVTQDTGAVAQIYLAQANQLMTSVNRFRSKNLFQFPVALAEKLEFDYEGTSYLMEKIHEKWILRLPAGKRLTNQSDVENILSALSPLRASASETVSTSDLSQYGLDKPVFRATVTCGGFSENDPPQSFGPVALGAIPADAPDQRYVQISGRDGVFRVSRSVLEAVGAGLEGLEPIVPGNQ